MLSNSRIDGRIARAAICLWLAASAVACATQTEPVPIALPAAPLPALSPPPLAVTPEVRAKPSRTVIASYQGDATAGQPTASGDPYNPNDLTAASRSLPLGSTIKVTNLATGRSVKVRINDRGPFVHGRSLDLSKSAAEKIGMTDKGVTRVRVTRIINAHPGSTEPEAPSPAGKAAAL